MTKSHRWSGWPGAWCLDCGTEMKAEICVGTHDHAFKTVPPADDNCWTGLESTIPPECQDGPCPEPGSARHDPYARMKGTEEA